MPVTRYGIYLSYAPGVDLRHEGLGRYLAAFLKGTSGRQDVQFVLVCPSWSKEGLEALFVSEGVEKTQFEVISPDKQPLMLRIFQWYSAFKKRKKKKKQGFLRRMVGRCARGVKKVIEYVEYRLVTMNSIIDILFIVTVSLLSLLLAITFSPLLLVWAVLSMLNKARRLTVRAVAPHLRGVQKKFGAIAGGSKDDAFVLRLYREVEKIESERMLEIVNKMYDIRAWYSPTAFWPAFNKIKRPTLMCVPDVVLGDFPVGFSNVGGARFFSVFRAVEKAIHTGKHFITYSDAIKWNTLVQRYAVHPADVTVVHHAPNRLDRWVNLQSDHGQEALSRGYAKGLLVSALQKCTNKGYSAEFKNGDVKFMFYASQFRPNKNVLTLLRAYKELLRTHHIGHKLIMTGHPHVLPEIEYFINSNGLQNDVLCLHGLTLKQLSACYKLADLAVNPTLSEGGCPFTFTEALSVDTPVVMSQIPVAEEVITDPAVRAVTFFDPYDYRDMVRSIKFALENPEQLLAVQKPFYEILRQRTWVDVVNEHIDVLERVSSPLETDEPAYERR